MENKLVELKEQFCKWYCPVKDTTYELNCVIRDHKVKLYRECEDCNNEQICDSRGFVYMCPECQVKNFIKFVRN